MKGLKEDIKEIAQDTIDDLLKISILQAKVLILRGTNKEKYLEESLACLLNARKFLLAGTIKITENKAKEKILAVLEKIETVGLGLLKAYMQSKLGLLLV